MTVNNRAPCTNVQKNRKINPVAYTHVNHFFLSSTHLCLSASK